MSALPKTVWTPEQYLAFERQSPTRHEYIGGEVLAMAGASKAHKLINLNIAASFHRQIRTRPCQAYVSDMRVKISPKGDYTYPDVVVVCGEPQLEDQQGDTLINPTVIVEVLSPSTADYDRTYKLSHYRLIPSLQEYILVSQDQLLVQQYTRHGDMWVFQDAVAPESVIRLAAIDCELMLAEIYEKVVFPQEETA